MILAGGAGAYFTACGGDSTTTDGGPDVQTSDQKTNDVTPTDTGTKDGATDAPVDAGPACNLANPFSTPAILASLNLGAGATRGARLSPDYLTAYYEYGALLYTASRTSPSGDTFTGNTELASLDTDGGTSSGPTLSPDQLTIYFASDRTGTSQIYFATRTTKTGAFGSPAVVTGLLGANVAQSSPFVQGDNSSLYFVANLPDAGVGSTDIYRATITGPGALSSPADVTELNTTGGDGPIGVTADGLTAYFSRAESPDGGAAAHLKMWKASRTNTSLPFSGLVGVVELNGPDTANDDMAWVSNDGCQITLASFRPVDGGSGVNIFISNK